MLYTAVVFFSRHTDILVASSFRIFLLVCFSVKLHKRGWIDFHDREKPFAQSFRICDLSGVLRPSVQSTAPAFTRYSAFV